MQMAKTELEIFHIPESICLPFHCFDFVDEAFNPSAGNTMREIVQKTILQLEYRAGHLDQSFHPGHEGVKAPLFEKLLGLRSTRLFPDQP